jgi:hypothetical protein
MNMDRRRFIGSAAGMATTTGVAARCLWPKHSVSYRRPRSLVAILKAVEYSEKTEDLLTEGLRLFRFNLPGKTVLLKPNLVEDLPGPVNTNANIIGAAARCFLGTPGESLADQFWTSEQRNADGRCVVEVRQAHGGKLSRRRESYFCIPGR